PGRAPDSQNASCRRSPDKLLHVNRTSFASLELSDLRFERDGLRVITGGSRALGRRADICYLATPVGTSRATLPLLILPHGAGGSAWSWPLNGAAPLTAAGLVEAEEIAPVALAMPS